MAFYKIRASRKTAGNILASQFIGEKDDLFYDATDRLIRISDGTTVGGIPLNAATTTTAEIVYATRVDFVGTTYVYKGQALPGTVDSAAAWKIQRITFVGSDEDVVIEWANGNNLLTNQWTNRASIAYS